MQKKSFLDIFISSKHPAIFYKSFDCHLADFGICIAPRIYSRLGSIPRCLQRQDWLIIQIPCSLLRLGSSFDGSQKSVIISFVGLDSFGWCSLRVQKGFWQSYVYNFLSGLETSPYDIIHIPAVRVDLEASRKIKSFKILNRVHIPFISLEEHGGCISLSCKSGP